MATDFKTAVDSSEIRRMLGIFQDQYPFAMSQAIDLCLYASKKVVKADLSQHFMIRTPFVPRSLTVDRPNKTHLQGWIGWLPRAWFMESQVIGQKDRTKPGNKPIWAPLSTGPLAPRPNIAEAILKDRRPNAVRRRGTKTRGKGIGYFKVIEGAIAWPGIYYRDPNETDPKKKSKLHAAYWLEESTTVDARYPLDERVSAAVAAAWPAAAKKAVERALKSRR